MPDQISLPGMEKFEPDDLQDFTEGAPKRGTVYFDASILPDTPDYQPNANGTSVYTLFVLFESYEALKRAVFALSGGKRKGLSTVAKIATVSGSRVMEDTGKTYLEYWEERLIPENKK